MDYLTRLTFICRTRSLLVQIISSIMVNIVLIMQWNSLFERITISHIGPERDDSLQTPVCKLDSDWTNFRSIGAGLAITGSIFSKAFCTFFGHLLNLTALIDGTQLNFISNYLSQGLMTYTKWTGMNVNNRNRVFMHSAGVAAPILIRQWKTWTRHYCITLTGLDRLDRLVSLELFSVSWPSSLSLWGVLGPMIKLKGACRLRECYKAHIIILISNLIQRLKALGLITVSNIINTETVYEHKRRWWALPEFYTEVRWITCCSWSLTECNRCPARASSIRPDLTTEPGLDFSGARRMGRHLWSWIGCAGHPARAPATYSIMTLKPGFDLIKQLITCLILNVIFDFNND